MNATSPSSGPPPPPPLPVEQGVGTACGAELVTPPGSFQSSARSKSESPSVPVNLSNKQPSRSSRHTSVSPLFVVEVRNPRVCPAGENVGSVSNVESDVT